jgi:hypothetical protein
VRWSTLWTRRGPVGFHDPLLTRETPLAGALPFRA